MSATTNTPATTATFTAPKPHALHSLRSRYVQGWDLFSSKELERLRFPQWLYQAGRLEQPERNAA
jgi:hypothetical protein